MLILGGGGGFKKTVVTSKFVCLLQFNENFLITIEEHVYSCQYGTFIGNAMCQREELNIRDRTYSLWGHICFHNDEYLNPLYDKSTSKSVLRPNIVPQNIRFWRGLYCRFETGAVPPDPVIDLLGLTASQTTSLEEHGRHLSKTIDYYKQKISNAKSIVTGNVSGASSAPLDSPMSAATASVSPTESSSSQLTFAISVTDDTPVQPSPNVSDGATRNGSDLDHVEKTFADLDTTMENSTF